MIDNNYELEISNPLSLKVDDDTLVRWIDERIGQSDAFYNKEKHLDDRRERNKNFLFGKQVDKNKLEEHQEAYMDNIIYEGEGTIKPIALSRLPDMTVKPSSDEEESKEAAKNLGEVLNTDLKKRENRKALALAFKHLPVYYIGVIKAFWDPEKGEDGDYAFKCVHPKNIVIDHTATDTDTRNMDFISEETEMSVKEVIMRFPKKKDEILESLGWKEDWTNKTKEEKMASKIKTNEVWFTWWDTVKDPETGQTKYERIEGVIWKYKKVLLDKMRNPNWDWEGERKLFTYEMGKKRDLSEDELRQSLFGEEANEETIFHNHFEQPMKPYILLGYDQWGEMPLDETSRIEQVISLQRNVNKRGLQITDINDRSRGQNVWSDEAVRKGDVEKLARMAMNPRKDIVVTGDVRSAMTHIPGVTASASLFQEQNQERSKAFAKMGTNATTRGEKVSDVATTNQILREQDFGRIDDIVEETINDAAEQMSAWAMQFIKLRYTAEHMRRLLGKDGDTTFVKISRDLVEDGMEVMVSASGVDKVQRKREAFEKAKLGLIDPLQFFIDTDSSDPRGRTEKLLLFKLEPLQYYQQFVKERDVTQQAEALDQAPVAPAELPPPPQAQPQPQQALPQGGGGEGWSNMMNRY